MLNPFSQPQLIKAEVFMSMPAKFRKKARSAWSDPNRQGAEVECFLEGPSFDREGNLWFVDIPFGRVFRITPKGRGDHDWDLVTQYDGWPNGLKIHRDGRIFIADYKEGLLVLDPRTGKLENILRTVYSEGFKGLNDLHFASNGDLYFTDQGQTGIADPTGRVFRLRANGALDRLCTNVPSPNGITLSTTEKHCYVAVTRSQQIWRLPLMADGSISKTGVAVQLSGGAAGPDGIEMDAENGLLVCHLGIGVWRFDANMLPTHLVHSEDHKHHHLANIAFGGPDLKTLYITESLSGDILVAQMPVAGKQRTRTSDAMTRDIRSILIYGYGVMGRGVARTFAESGFETVIRSSRARELTDLPQGASASDKLPAAAPDLVIELVPEDVAAKRAVYAEIEAAYPDAEVLIASGTSGLDLVELAAGLRRPERFLGIHYFMPADKALVVEVMAGPATPAATVDLVAAALRRSGKEPVALYKPIVGFLVNRLQHAILHEAYYLIEAGVASVADIDHAARRMLAPRMCLNGLIQQKDVSGLEIHAGAQASIVPKLYHNSIPNPMLQAMARSGETGLAAGKGFYDWAGCDVEAVRRQASEQLGKLQDFLDSGFAVPAPGTQPAPRDPRRAK